MARACGSSLLCGAHSGVAALGRCQPSLQLITSFGMHGACPPLHGCDLLMLSGTAAVQGNISSWKKKEGEPFGPGDVLAEIETDKVPAFTNTSLTAAPSPACKSLTRRCGLAAWTVERQSTAEACVGLLHTGAGAVCQHVTLTWAAQLSAVSERCVCPAAVKRAGKLPSI